MNENRLNQMFGWSLALGGIIGIVTHILHPDEPKTPEQIHMYVLHTPAAHVGVWFGVLLMLLGLPQLFVRLSRSTGVVAVISLPLIFMGLALADGMHCPLEFGALPAIYRVAPKQIGEIYVGFSATPYGMLTMIGGAVMMLGMLLFVIGVAITGHLPGGRAGWYWRPWWAWGSDVWRAGGGSPVCNVVLRGVRRVRSHDGAEKNIDCLISSTNLYRTRRDAPLECVHEVNHNVSTVVTISRQ